MSDANNEGLTPISTPIEALVDQSPKESICIKISTVAFESAFSTGGCVLDQYHSRLNPSIVEALVCPQVWLKSEQNKEEDSLLSLSDDNDCDELEATSLDYDT